MRLPSGERFEYLLADFGVKVPSRMLRLGSSRSLGRWPALLLLVRRGGSTLGNLALRFAMDGCGRRERETCEHDSPALAGVSSAALCVRTRASNDDETDVNNGTTGRGHAL